MNFTKKQIYLALFLLSAGHFAVDFMIGILPVYKTMERLDIAAIGLIAGLCAFFGEGVQVLFGPLGDKGYRRSLAMLGVGGTVAATCFSYTTDYTILFILYLLTCIGSGAFHPSAVSIISHLTTKQKALFISIFSASGSFGFALSQLTFSSAFIWLQGHTLLLGVPSIVLIGIMAKKLLETPSNATLESRARFQLFVDFFKDNRLRNLYITCLANQSLVWGMIFLLPDALRAKGYENWACLGGGHLFFIFGAVCTLVPAGYFADRYSPRSVLLSAVLVGTVSLYIFLFNGVLPSPLMCSLLFITGAALGIINPIAVALGNRVMPENPGIVNACLMGLVWCIAEGIGQTGGGYLTSLFEDEAPVKALMLLGFATLFSFSAAYMLPVLEEKTIPA